MKQESTVWKKSEKRKDDDIWPQHTMFMHDELSKKEISFFFFFLSSRFSFDFLLVCAMSSEIRMHWMPMNDSAEYVCTVECTKEKCEMSRFNSWPIHEFRCRSPIQIVDSLILYNSHRCVVRQRSGQVNGVHQTVKIVPVVCSEFDLCLEVFGQNGSHRYYKKKKTGR